MMGLGNGDSFFSYGHFCYLFYVKFLGLIHSLIPYQGPVRYTAVLITAALRLALGFVSAFTITPPKTNMSHENQWLEDVFHIEIVPFWGTC